MTRLYRFDPETKEYLDFTDVPDNSIKIEGKSIYGMPAYHTLVAPMQVKKGYTCCYSIGDINWYLVEDHRGTIVYSKEDLSETTIDFLGKIPEDKYLLNKPEPKNEYQIWKDGKYVYPEINELRITLKEELDKKFNVKLQVPYSCGDYYVLPNWADTYTTTLVAMQQDLQEDGTLDEEYKILLITDPVNNLLKQIKLKTLEEFMPYYNKVKEVYKELATEYHDKIARLSTLKTPDALVRLIFNY